MALMQNAEYPLLAQAGFTSDHCLKCNICTAACPVVNVTDQFLGPKAVGPQAERFRHPRLPIPDATVSWCSGCGTCSRVCPHGVSVTEMNVQAKARLTAQHGAPLRDHFISRPEMLGQLSKPFAGIVNSAMEKSLTRFSLEKLLAIHRSAPLPKFATHTFRERFPERCVKTPPEQADPGKRLVAYFHGCSTNYYEPELGEIAIAVLEALGCSVLLPPQNCCGLPLQSNGLFRQARRYGKANIRHLIPFAEKEIPIVGTSTSCTLELKHEYREVLGLSGRDFDLIAEWTRDIFEFLLEEFSETIEDVGLKPVPRRVLYHAPCQLKSHCIGTPALEILRRIPELDIVLSESECCGVAGTYGVKLERYQAAYAVGEHLFQQAEQSNVDIVVTDSETCRWWISQHTGIPAQHPIAVLAESLGL
ncbi:MAG: anaerobic glycerol-3-phosphate dehydrogenase subunit C [Anaerolineales bacterium]|nr:anaerobic glycerol-3-phosphate dehydrogenase subunit C [Anaerolineales bacterium]